MMLRADGSSFGLRSIVSSQIHHLHPLLSLRLQINNLPLSLNPLRYCLCFVKIDNFLLDVVLFGFDAGGKFGEVFDLGVDFGEGGGALAFDAAGGGGGCCRLRLRFWDDRRFGVGDETEALEGSWDG